MYVYKERKHATYSRKNEAKDNIYEPVWCIGKLLICLSFFLAEL
jgi:hypothetical protein